MTIDVYWFTRTQQQKQRLYGPLNSKQPTARRLLKYVQYVVIIIHSFNVINICCIVKRILYKSILRVSICKMELLGMFLKYSLTARYRLLYNVVLVIMLDIKHNYR